MNEKNFINFHILISHSPSCLNRDDMNMQKSAIFGGQRRVRISSQSLKHAFREHPYFKNKLSNKAIRTREVSKLYARLTEELTNEFPKELIEDAISFLADKRGISSSDELIQGDAVAPWVSEEVNWLCQQLQHNETVQKNCKRFLEITGNSTDDKKRKRLIINSTYKEFNKIDQLKGLEIALSNALEVALYGRMAASGLMKSIDGALALAHTITTHSVDADLDWFTAVDDLQESGSGHLDTQEFSSGVFYRYASLNIQQLLVNLGDADRIRALEIGGHLLHMLATIVPSAKQQSFAAHNLAECALVSFSDMPISLANAFEQPVKDKGGSGLLKPSIERLIGYWQKVHQGYALDERTAAFLLGNESTPDNLQTFAALNDLKSWVANDAKE